MLVPAKCQVAHLTAQVSPKRRQELSKIDHLKLPKKEVREKGSKPVADFGFFVFERLFPPSS